MQKIIQAKKYSLEKLWLQAINKCCIQQKFTENALYLSKWLILHICEYDINDFLFGDENIDILEDLDIIKHWIFAKLGQEKILDEIYGEIFIHYFSVFLNSDLTKNNEILIRIAQFCLEIFDPLTIKICENLQRICQGFFKVFIRMSQNLENTQNSELLIKCRIKGLECKIKGFPVNHKETCEIIICSLFSILKNFEANMQNLNENCEKLLLEYKEIAEKSCILQINFYEECCIEFYSILYKIFQNVFFKFA